MSHCFISLADLEAAGTWSQLEGFKDPELQQLALGVPDMLLSGEADSTTKKYIGAFRRWKLWAEARQEVQSFPAQEAHVVLYMQHLGQSVQSKAARGGGECIVMAASGSGSITGQQPTFGAGSSGGTYM